MQAAGGKDRCLTAICGGRCDRVPVFPLLMFFAADRAGLSYRTFATDGAAFAEAQLKMMERFGLDAITACSDAFRLSADLGGEMAYPEDKPPYLARPLVTCAADIDRLGRPDPSAGRQGDRVGAVRRMARAAGPRALVLGWVEMPFAEACDLCGLSEFMMLLTDEPAAAHRLLDLVTRHEIAFALAQIEAGAVMIGAGDAAASLISPEMYREFALPYERRVADAVHAAGGLVKLHICGNTAALLNDMPASGADLFNVDHLVDFDAACNAYGAAGVAFKGNLDPVSELMQSTPERCRAACRERITRARGLRYLLSAGCEIPAATPDAVFEAFCTAWRD